MNKATYLNMIQVQPSDLSSGGVHDRPNLFSKTFVMSVLYSSISNEIETIFVKVLGLIQWKLVQRPQ